MGTCYTATAAIAYAASGDAVKGFLPESMPSGPAKSVVSLLLVTLPLTFTLTRSRTPTRCWRVPTSRAWSRRCGSTRRATYSP